MKKLLLILLTVSSFSMNAQKEFGDGVYATFHTDKGEIIVKFTTKETPMTVANFVALAEGKQPIVDKKFSGKKFFDQLSFHRVIPDFMIQGGDPSGDGSGNPGYFFPDEIVPELKHDKPGVLSMANRGPATNGSQFFITHKATPWLDGKHTVFGYVVKGQEVVNAIEQNDKMNTVVVTRVGKEFQKFKGEKVYPEALANLEKVQEERKAQAEIEKKKLEQEVKLASEKANAITADQVKKLVEANAVKFASIKQNALELPSGLKVYVYEKGSGNKPQNGESVNVEYSGFLENGSLFDSGIEDVAIAYKMFNPQRKMAKAYAPITFVYGNNINLIKGFREGIMQLNKGDKAYLIIPPSLGYGENGVGAIPGNSTLIFDIHLK